MSRRVIVVAMSWVSIAIATAAFSFTSRVLRS